MKVKQYRASTLQEAFVQAQAELGEDAVLLHQKEISQPAQFGRRGQTLVEITVGVDTPSLPDPTQRTAAFPSSPARTYGAATPRPQARPASSASHLGPASTPKQDDLEILRREMTQIRALLQQSRRRENLPEALAAWSDALHECGLPTPWIDRILDGLGEKLPPAALVRPDIVGAALRKRMVAEMAPPIGALQPGKPGQPSVVVLAGPTGVGKTTTIAKLAAHFAMQKRLPIAIITTDTFRIGAVGQLRTYSELMRAPLDVAYTPQDLSDLIARHQDKALILVDTPGRSPADKEQLGVLESFVAAVQDPHLYIALAAGASLADARRIVACFSVQKPQGLLLTKVDETEHFGPAWTLLAESGLPLSYFTTGQRVPEDIEVAGNEALLDRLLMLARQRVADTETQPMVSFHPTASRLQGFTDFSQYG